MEDNAPAKEVLEVIKNTWEIKEKTNTVTFNQSENKQHLLKIIVLNPTTLKVRR